MAEPTIQTEPRAPDRGFVRRFLPWIIAAVAVLAAAIAIAVIVVDRSNDPQPVAQLAAQPGSSETIPIDEEFARASNFTAADFVFHGSYGALGIWSVTEGEARCLALVAESHISVFNCSAPTVDTIADFNIDPQLVPPAPSGERTAQLRFVHHDDVVDVYLAPRPEGGYY
jgi:hypothetical protein